MHARIVDVTPAGGPEDLTIWQLETRPDANCPWHRDYSGAHTSQDYEALARIARDIDPTF